MDAAVTKGKIERQSVIPTDPRTKIFLTVNVSNHIVTGGPGGVFNTVRPGPKGGPGVVLLLFK